MQLAAISRIAEQTPTAAPRFFPALTGATISEQRSRGDSPPISMLCEVGERTAGTRTDNATIKMVVLADRVH